MSATGVFLLEMSEVATARDVGLRTEELEKKARRVEPPRMRSPEGRGEAAPVGCPGLRGRPMERRVQVDVGARPEQIGVVLDPPPEEGMAEQMSLPRLPVQLVDPARIASMQLPPDSRITKWWWFFISAQASVAHPYFRAMRVYIRRKHSCSPTLSKSVVP
jgi:hypothetical protein